jgi:hypothetical protein
MALVNRPLQTSPRLPITIRSASAAFCDAEGRLVWFLGFGPLLADRIDEVDVIAGSRQLERPVACGERAGEERERPHGLLLAALPDRP